MSAISRILCPVDFSEFSRRALELAAGLADRHEAQLTALHVTAPALPPTAAFPEVPAVLSLNPAIRHRLEAELESFVAPAREKGAAVTIVLREGAIVSEILRQAELLGCDLVVMGTHGAGGFERWVLGSVSEKVLRKAPCPVLTVAHVPKKSAEAEPGRFHEILCAVDLERSSPRTLDHAVATAADSGAHLTLLHVLEDALFEEATVVRAGMDLAAYNAGRGDDAREKLGSLVAAIPPGLAIDTVVTAGKPDREILRLAREREADLIVVGVHGRRAGDLLHFGSTAHHVVRGACAPVLTIRERREKTQVP
jgi:nucleotide-binding universal stress UspA family protein